ncbi:hypothetical protein SAMN05660649_04332 [Desulfotomaculum arcticum]|uniref:Uncharacterized protein n=1 Tax=Desulfotruncus arcticus DSM 17038 TaxID=1121424 RepID=A0A1I2Y9U8_9FIRM|nr:hypothetical protein [Desulfotruncus arcticus]SFH22405.1 hypothetical protein SAMN05660649_04332 [Desulfotomaculum arcticum] [Desulfotruncus arcticus DSM 17038]
MYAFDRYRMDNRTVEQFAEDIAQGTRVEREIISWYVRYYEMKYKIALEVEDNGCDNSGKLLERGEVNTLADFKLNGQPVEVKFNNKRLLRFHFKVDQLESYLKQRASVIWVNGYETDSPVFTVLKTVDLERIRKTRKPVAFLLWGGKMCYEIQAQEFKWLKFEGRTTVEK